MKAILKITNLTCTLLISFCALSAEKADDQKGENLQQQLDHVCLVNLNKEVEEFEKKVKMISISNEKIEQKLKYNSICNLDVEEGHAYKNCYKPNYTNNSNSIYTNISSSGRTSREYYSLSHGGYYTPGNGESSGRTSREYYSLSHGGYYIPENNSGSKSRY